MKYSIHIYEPAVNPGGFQREYEIEAETMGQAGFKVLEEAASECERESAVLKIWWQGSYIIHPQEKTTS